MKLAVYVSTIELRIPIFFDAAWIQSATHFIKSIMAVLNDGNSCESEGLNPANHNDKTNRILPPSANAKASMRRDQETMKTNPTQSYHFDSFTSSFVHKQ